MHADFPYLQLVNLIYSRVGPGQTRICLIIPACLVINPVPRTGNSLGIIVVISATSPWSVYWSAYYVWGLQCRTMYTVWTLIQPTSGSAGHHQLMLLQQLIVYVDGCGRRGVASVGIGALESQITWCMTIWFLLTWLGLQGRGMGGRAYHWPRWVRHLTHCAF